MDYRKILILSLILSSFLIPPVFSASIQDLYDKSFSFEQKGEYKKALNKTIEILRTDKENYTANLRCAWLYHLNKDYKNSIKLYNKASEIKPLAIEPLMGKSLPLIAEKKWKEAEDVLKIVIDKAPGNYTGKSRLAYVLYSLGKYSRAASVYRSLIQSYPADTEMKLGLGWTYIKMGNKVDAEKYFKEVLGVYKNNISALSGLDEIKKL